ncbi:tyrosine-type recombinase/integrase [Thioclava electrotropha]|uniref:Site-specific integrase n=1 Tax=Thioclava electrotropha TaxID=1549850 RepID=A0ABX6YPP0_9RHOB|nr:tyrosine-type recombinase/integrase [Thioclava electrotropha]QPZ89695.1 site-specific integrase [Thioclava electrotropha]
MNMQNQKKLDLAFIPEGTPMFSDLITMLEAAEDLSGIRRRDMISGLSRVAKALGRLPQDVPCFGRWLQPRLAKITPASLNLTSKSWQNAVSDARAAMAHVGILERRSSRIYDLIGEWQHLWQIVLEAKDPTLPLALRRFVFFLSNRGTLPANVSGEDADAYLEALIHNEISKNPEVPYRAAVNGWNLAVKRIPEWPRITLSLPSRQNVIKLDEAALPQSFIADLDALMARLATPDPLASDGRTRALRPVTLKQYRRQLIRFASELVHSGVSPETLTSLDVLLDPTMAERGLRQMLSRTENSTTKMISEVAALLRNLGKITGQSEDVQKRLKGLAGKVATSPQRGITRKNRDRLRVLQDERRAQRLLNLPEHLFNQSPRTGARSYQRALAREDALAIAILLYCPIRIRNLAGIHLEQHLQRPGDGRVFLVLTEDEVKNGQPLEFELPREVVLMIEKHLATRAPELCPKGTPWIFPRRDGSNSVDPNQLSERIKKRIRKETGVEMNAHLFRHFAVMNWLDASPGSYEAARRLLGHSEVSHTINMYSGLENKAATKAFAELVGRKKGPRK